MYERHARTLLPCGSRHELGLDCSQGSSLIWSHSSCIIDYQSAYIDSNDTGIDKTVPLYLSSVIKSAAGCGSESHWGIMLCPGARNFIYIAEPVQTNKKKDMTKNCCLGPEASTQTKHF